MSLVKMIRGGRIVGARWDAPKRPTEAAQGPRAYIWATAVSLGAN